VPRPGPEAAEAEEEKAVRVPLRALDGSTQGHGEHGLGERGLCRSSIAVYRGRRPWPLARRGPDARWPRAELRSTSALKPLAVVAEPASGAGAADVGQVPALRC
jgi:hypothetical protein